MKLSREQAFAFIESLWPVGHVSFLENPTRTYFSALLGHVPQAKPWDRSDINRSKAKEMAEVLRAIADHLEEEAGDDSDTGRRQPNRRAARPPG